jgi:non-lysosomal glucosylceramidase
MPDESSISRRRLLQAAAAFAAVALLESAGNRTARAATDSPVENLESLTARGEPAILTGDDLKFIGMPVGGLCAGQVYLGGNGSLWLWDVFNQLYNSGCGGPHYAKPMTPHSTLLQRFELSVDDGPSRPLTDFPDVRFRGTYPIGTVYYEDPNSLLNVRLEAFSPFVPLDIDQSSLPATVMRFEVINRTEHEHRFRLTGLLENVIGTFQKGRTPVRTLTKIRDGTNLLMELGATAPGDQTDIGTMSIGLLNSEDADDAVENAATASAGGPVANVTRSAVAHPNQSVVVVFILAWHFPNLHIDRLHSTSGRHYATRFKSSAEVVRHVAPNAYRFYAQTQMWRDTWYDSTLPYWFLDRTFIPVSVLATSTCYRFADGRFYGWEGVGSCEGTCLHVWGYEQSMGRLFPELDRSLREMVDFNPAIAFAADGHVGFRGEFDRNAAIDGQAMLILRCLRDHQTSPTRKFLDNNWPSIKKATQWLIDQDTAKSGILTGAQMNTLDTKWYGPVAWLSGLYIAALRAAAAMADVVGDKEFQHQCDAIANSGGKHLVADLFNGDYFINKPDPSHADAINSGTGCEIDQLLGQSWAHQVGLPRIVPKEQTVSALKSLFSHNFTNDVGPYRRDHKPGRWYAMPGEAGLLMCSFPDPTWNYDQAKGKGPDWAAGYFNECMTGFEHQVAGHMIHEGLVAEGLTIEKAIHDRYAPSKRNPYNEIECGDHYARSMAAFGVYLAACGFQHDGPSGKLGFAPKIAPENFRGPFVTAAGWGTFSQKITAGKLTAEIEVKHGELALEELSLELPGGAVKVTATLNDKPVDLTSVRIATSVNIRVAKRLVISAGDALHLQISPA